MIASTALLLQACDSQPEGEPVISASLDGEGEIERNSPAPSPLPNEKTQATDNPNSACRSANFEGVALTHCIADPKKHRITTVLADDEDKPFRSLRAYAGAIGADASKRIAFAVNGGMFGDEGEAIGYYVEKGDRKVKLNRNDGPGNFHMKPNGVFFGSGNLWNVFDSDRFYSNVRDRPRFGTQSGPMLVIEGKLHPEIADNGPSRAIRNGVGIDAEGKAHFVQSDEPISFGQLARFYRDRLKTPNALYLDGNVSALWDPANERLDVGAPLGPLIVVTKREGSAP